MSNISTFQSLIKKYEETVSDENWNGADRSKSRCCTEKITVVVQRVGEEASTSGIRHSFEWVFVLASLHNSINKRFGNK